MDPKGPTKGQPPQFSPEQICLDVGRIQAPARLAWAIVIRVSFQLPAFSSIVVVQAAKVSRSGNCGSNELKAKS